MSCKDPAFTAACALDSLAQPCALLLCEHCGEAGQKVMTAPHPEHLHHFVNQQKGACRPGFVGSECLQHLHQEHVSSAFNMEFETSLHGRASPCVQGIYPGASLQACKVDPAGHKRLQCAVCSLGNARIAEQSASQNALQWHSAPVHSCHGAAGPDLLIGRARQLPFQASKVALARFLLSWRLLLIASCMPGLQIAVHSVALQHACSFLHQHGPLK